MIGDTMMTLRLTGHITEDGKLELELPEGLPPGAVQVILELAEDAYDDDPVQGFREAWADIMEGRVYPISMLWDEIDDEDDDEATRSD